MNSDDYTTNGFFLALDVMGSLGVSYYSDGRKFQADEVMQRLYEVARGETSVYNSPAEELAEAEENRGGQPATEELAYFQSAMADRKGHDRRNAETAQQVIRGIGDTPPPPPPRGPMMV